MGSKFRSSIIRSMFLIGCLSLLFANVRSVPTPVKQIRSLVNVINDITTLFTGMDGLIKLIQNDDSNEVFQKKVTNQLDDIYDACLKIDSVKNQVKNVNYAVSLSTEEVIATINLGTGMSYMLQVEVKLDQIESLYERDFNNYYQALKNPGTNETFKHHVTSMIENEDLHRFLRDIVKATELSGDNSTLAVQNIFGITAAKYKNEKHYHRDCNDISAYDKLYNYYKYVMATVTHGYTLIIMGFQYLRLHSNDPSYYRNMQLIYFNSYKNAIIKMTESAQYYLALNNDANFKSSISCDPQSWKEGENYIRVKNYVSFRTPTLPHYGFMHSEPDRRGIEYECPGFAEYGDWAVPELIATKYCTSPFTPTSKSSAYSEFTDHATRLLERKCALGSYSPLEERCYSDESSDPILSVRKLSLLLQTCSSKRNEVVTNARFHVQDGIISIEIQCGVFIDGKVDRRTLWWNTNDRGYTRANHPNYVVLSALLKSFNLDDIELPDGEFVTGMKFEKLDDNRLSLVLQGTEMYDSNNQIISGQTSLRFPQNTGNPREKIDLFLLTAPWDLKNQTYEISESGRHYIELTESRESYEYQSTAIVPFFDMQPVRLLHAAPLGGLGLFYKGQPSYAGFLAFKLISPKYVHFISGNYADNLTITSVSAY